MIHKIFNTEYELLFFHDCIALKNFDSEATFYKDFIEKHINDPAQLKYELENVYPKHVDNKTENIIKYFRKQFKK